MASAGQRMAKNATPYSRYGKWIFLLCGAFLLQNKIGAQEKIPCNAITAEMGFTVSAVRVTGRWVPSDLQATVEQLAGLGQAFDPGRVSAALETVRDRLIESERTFGIRLAGSTSALYVDADVCDVSDSLHPKAVQVKIRAYYLRIDLYNTGNNILPVPRSAKPTFFEQVPKNLSATSPRFGFINDRQFGPALFLQTHTDLLQRPFAKTTRATKHQLNLGLNARRSFSDSFYEFGAALEFNHPVYSDTTLGWSIGSRYEQGRQPFGNGAYNLRLFQMQAAIQGNASPALFRKYAVSGGVRFLQNRYASQRGLDRQNAEHAYTLNITADGRIGRGFSRLGLWGDAGVPKGSDSLKAYQRLAARAGYAVGLGKSHNSVEAELNIGIGHTWGSPPAYNRFFAGNAAWNFLYESLASVRNRRFPDGAILRSLGEREGTFVSPSSVLSGGTSYWHLNLNIAIPIAKWSRPLIPDAVITEEPRRITLRSALKAQVQTAQNFIENDLIENRGFPENDETAAVAERIVEKDIRPTINYLADRANIYAVRPLLLFDLARLGNGNGNGLTWVAAGAGVQMNVVNARLEAGYMRTLRPTLYKGTGNLFLRFTVQNFF